MEIDRLSSRRATVAEIARRAGVGTATVDRVLNGRQGVREETRQRVQQAKAAIEHGSPSGPGRKPWRLKVLLPELAGASTEYLGQCFQEFGALGHATIECVYTKKMEPALLARKLRACAGHGLDAVAFQALEDPRVHNAVEYLHSLDIPTLGLLSGLANRHLIGTAGVDNRAAGRTAGFLMGRLAQQPGSVAIVTGGQLYRIHEDREMGFRAALRNDFPKISDVIVLNGHDDASRIHRVVRAALDSHPELVGIYNVGGGNEGVARTLRENGVADELVFIGHNLTERTQAYLLDGTMDIVLHLSMRDVAASATDAMIAHLENRQTTLRPLPISVVTRENVVGMTLSPSTATVSGKGL